MERMNSNKLFIVANYNVLKYELMNISWTSRELMTWRQNIEIYTAMQTTAEERLALKMR